MCSVLMSIKPKYAHRIMTGEKKYEFRKKACKRKVDKILIYSTVPDQRVVGEAEVECVLIDSPAKLWKKTEKAAGIEKDLYDHYFENMDSAVAYKIGNVVKYKTPKTLLEIGVKVAPQSFQYI